MGCSEGEGGEASVRERVRASGVSSMIERDKGRVCGVTACHDDIVCE